MALHSRPLDGPAAQTTAFCVPPADEVIPRASRIGLLFRLRTRRLAYVHGAPVGALERRGHALAPAENPLSVVQPALWIGPSPRSARRCKYISRNAAHLLRKFTIM